MAMLTRKSGIGELKIFTELRNVDSCKNISRPQLESNILNAIPSGKSRPLSENAQYESYDWLVSHILESMKKICKQGQGNS